MGGTSRAEADHRNNPANMLYLCPACHDRTEHADTWRECEQLGWRVERGQRDPWTVPALLHTANGYGWWLLDDHGGYTWQDLPLEYRLTWRDDDGPDGP